MLCLPFNSPEAALRHVEVFGDRPNVGGFMVTTVRSDMAVYDNAYMKLYRALEERGLVLSFHSGPNWGEPIYKSCNRFLAAHALGFTWYNVVHCTNWVINGMGERFPKLPVIWIESGIAWVPFLMQRLDHEFMLRPSEAPLLKKKPSDYMRDMFYSSQPMEIQDYGAMECTFRMMNAETQLLYSSDYPHWDFDLPSTIYDLPFLSEKAKHNILGGTAARLFKLPPRNDKQKENLKRFGNLAAARLRPRSAPARYLSRLGCPALRRAFSLAGRVSRRAILPAEANCGTSGAWNRTPFQNALKLTYLSIACRCLVRCTKC